jgi:DNA transposition AAA+ family ATPase
VDEADRLKMASLEQMRAIFDAGGIGLVLIGMTGLEKRLARYAEFYSRIGFVHEFRPLNAPEMRRLLAQGWAPAGVTLPTISTLDAETAAAIIRVTGGNFRLLDRLLTVFSRMELFSATQLPKCRHGALIGSMFDAQYLFNLLRGICREDEGCSRLKVRASGTMIGDS